MYLHDKMDSSIVEQAFRHSFEQIFQNTPLEASFVELFKISSFSGAFKTHGTAVLKEVILSMKEDDIKTYISNLRNLVKGQWYQACYQTKAFENLVPSSDLNSSNTKRKFQEFANELVCFIEHEVAVQHTHLSKDLFRELFSARHRTCPGFADIVYACPGSKPNAYLMHKKKVTSIASFYYYEGEALNGQGDCRIVKFDLHDEVDRYFYDNFQRNIPRPNSNVQCHLLYPFSIQEERTEDDNSNTYLFEKFHLFKDCISRSTPAQYIENIVRNICVMINAFIKEGYLPSSFDTDCLVISTQEKCPMDEILADSRKFTIKYNRMEIADATFRGGGIGCSNWAPQEYFCAESWYYLLGRTIACLLERVNEIRFLGIVTPSFIEDLQSDDKATRTKAYDDAAAKGGIRFRTCDGRLTVERTIEGPNGVSEVASPKSKEAAPEVAPPEEACPEQAPPHEACPEQAPPQNQGSGDRWTSPVQTLLSIFGN